METWKHIRAVLLLPFLAIAIIPGTLLFFTGMDTLDVWNQFPISRFISPIVGVLLVGFGLFLMVSTIRLFATVGRGTLAPWNPTKKLVVQGVYRHVRNPMISGVFFVLLGEAVSFASLPLVGWVAFFVVVNMIYMPLVEEPGLVKRFGEDYEQYRRNVPRWLPRLRAWSKDESPNS